MSPTIRFVHLEDDPHDAELVAATLVHGGIRCEIVRVQTQEDFRAALEGQKIDMILSDYALPSYDGLSALALARKLRPDVQFLLVSGTIGEEAAIESLKGGATDYVLKHRLERLVPAVQRALQESAERAELKRAEQQIREQAALLDKARDA